MQSATRKANAHYNQSKTLPQQDTNIQNKNYPYVSQASNMIEKKTEKSNLRETKARGNLRSASNVSPSDTKNACRLPAKRRNNL